MLHYIAKYQTDYEIWILQFARFSENSDYVIPVNIKIFKNFKYYIIFKIKKKLLLKKIYK